MSTELEESNEAARELLLEEVIHTVQEKNPKLVNRIGMVTLIMALASAVGGLMAGITSNEAMNERTQEVVDVIHLQNDNAELREIKTKHEILHALNVPVAIEINSPFWFVISAFAMIILFPSDMILPFPINTSPKKAGLR